LVRLFQVKIGTYLKKRIFIYQKYSKCVHQKTEKVKKKSKRKKMG
jgi:hypothetical protein